MCISSRINMKDIILILLISNTNKLLYPHNLHRIKSNLFKENKEFFCGNNGDKLSNDV